MDFIKEYTVSEIVNNLEKLIKENFYYIKITGEISNLKTSSNGHRYFNLKDKNSLINAVVFKNVKNNLILENGLSIRAFGQLTIYKEKSNYQIIIEAFEINGEGNLLKIFEDRKKKLENEGLFDENHKKLIPQKVNFIGIISSPTGAAIKDIEIRLKERKPIEVLLYPSLMQGQEAENTIIKGIKYFNDLTNKPDLIVITRGGGSLEDLMCFNGEKLANYIYNSDLPIITAIGHEIDWTIADYVADLRLPTPTSVADFLVETKINLKSKINNLIKQIRKIIITKIKDKQTKLIYIESKINFIKKHKKEENLKIKYMRLHNIYRKILDRIFKNFFKKKNRLNILYIKLQRHNITKILKKGFAVIIKDGYIINQNSKINKDDELIIKFINKEIKVKVI